MGGGIIVAGHLPDYTPGDGSIEIFRGHLDQFRGYLRLYFHPGYEGLRGSDLVGVRRGGSDHTVEIPLQHEASQREVVAALQGMVARLEIGSRRFHSVVTSCRHEAGTLSLTLADPVVTSDPDLLRILVDANPWVEARWIDSRGREWRDFSSVMRKLDR